MSKQKNSVFDLFKTLINSSLDRVHSNAGRANIIFGIMILIVIFFIIIQPISYYVLVGLQSICNLVLAICSKETILIHQDANNTFVIIFCLSSLIFESVFCTLLIKFSDDKKK